MKLVFLASQQKQYLQSNINIPPRAHIHILVHNNEAEKLWTLTVTIKQKSCMHNIALHTRTHNFCYIVDLELPALTALKTHYTFLPLLPFKSYSKLKYTPEQETLFSNLQCRQPRYHKYFRALKMRNALIRKGAGPSHHLTLKSCLHKK